MQTFLPRVIGRTAAAEARGRGRSGQRLTRESFLDGFEDDAVCGAAERLLDAAVQSGADNMTLAEARAEGWPDKAAWIEQFSEVRKLDRPVDEVEVHALEFQVIERFEEPVAPTWKAVPGGPGAAQVPSRSRTSPMVSSMSARTCPHFRVPSNLFQRWNESLITPFKQLHEGLDVRWARMEVVALIRVLLGQADDIEKVLPDFFRVRRGLPLFAPALPRWVSGAVNVYRPDWDGVSAWSVARVICTIGIERIRDVQIADLAMARNFSVKVCTAPLSPKRTIEPARAVAVGATVGHWFLPCRVGVAGLRDVRW